MSTPNITKSLDYYIQDRTVAPQYVLSKYLVLLVALVSTLDFMVVFITIYFYWSSLGGDYALFGFIFGSYDLSQLVFAPLLGFWQDKRSTKEVLVASLVLNIIGNVIYSVADKAGSRWVILAGRLVAGTGAANLAIVTTYLAKITSTKHRTAVIVEYRLVTFFGRFLGPLLGIALYFLPAFKIGEWKIYNYNSPALVTALLGFSLIIPILIFLKKPQIKKSALLTPPSRNPTLPKVTKPVREIIRELLLGNVVYFLIVFSFWTWYAQLIPIAGVEFGWNETEVVTYCYIPVAVGFFIANTTIRRVDKYINGKEVYWVVLSPILIIGGFLFFVQYTDSHQNLPDWRFFVGTGVATAGFAFCVTPFVAWYTKVTEGIPKQMGLCIAIFTSVGSLGRFLGPTWPTPVLKIGGFSETSVRNECCYVDGSDFDFSCCYFKNLNAILFIIIGTTVVAFVGVVSFLIRVKLPEEPGRNLSLTDEDAEVRYEGDEVPHGTHTAANVPTYEAINNDK